MTLPDNGHIVWKILLLATVLFFVSWQVGSQATFDLDEIVAIIAALGIGGAAWKVKPPE